MYILKVQFFFFSCINCIYGDCLSIVKWRVVTYMHIICPNTSTFLYLRCDQYFALSLFKFMRKENKIKSRKESITEVEHYFIRIRQDI